MKVGGEMLFTRVGNPLRSCLYNSSKMLIENLQKKLILKPIKNFIQESKKWARL
jgi:hypothetical protein